MTNKTFSQINLQTQDQKAKHAARAAIMRQRIRNGIVYERMEPYPLTAVGTPEELARLREKWGITQ